MSNYQDYDDVDWMISEKNSKHNPWFSTVMGALVVVAILLLILWIIISNQNKTTTIKGKPNYQIGYLQPTSSRWSYDCCADIAGLPIQSVLPQGGQIVEYANQCYEIAVDKSGGTATKFGITTGSNGGTRCFFNNAKNPHLPDSLGNVGPQFCRNDINGNPIGSTGTLALYNILKGMP